MTGTSSVTIEEIGKTQALGEEQIKEIQKQLLLTNIENGLKLGQFSFVKNEIEFKLSNELTRVGPASEPNRNVASSNGKEPSSKELFESSSLKDFFNNCNSLVTDSAKHNVNKISVSRVSGRVDKVWHGTAHDSQHKQHLYEVSDAMVVAVVSVTISQEKLMELAKAGVEMPDRIHSLLGVPKAEKTFAGQFRS